MMTARYFIPLLFSMCGGLCSVVWAADPLPKSPLTDQAREHYNAGQYKQAMALFIKLAHRHPHDRGVYRALAASANNAKVYHTAVKAYEIYLGLNPSKDEASKIQAELDNVKQQTKGKQSALWKSIRRTRKNLDLALKNEKLSGSNGALSLLRTLKKRQYFGPKFSDYHTQVWQLLEKRQDTLLDGYWHTNRTLDVEALSDFQDSIKTASDVFIRKDRIEEVQRMINALILHNDGKKTELLAFLGKSQIRDFRLRYLLAILLFEANRKAESIELLTAIGQQYQQPRALVRAQQMHLRTKKKIEEEDLDVLIDALDQLPPPGVKSGN